MNNDVSPSNGLDVVRKRISEQVSEGHWAIIGVGGDAGGPSFFYTIGLQNHQRPELIVFGLDFKNAQIILNTCAHKSIKDERYPDGWVLNDVASMPLTLKDCTNAGKINHTQQAFNFYGHWGFKLQQLVLPDKKGLFPWESGYDLAMNKAQHLLYQNVVLLPL